MFALSITEILTCTLSLFLLVSAVVVSATDQHPFVGEEGEFPPSTLSSGYTLGAYLGPELPFPIFEPLEIFTGPLLGIYLGPSQLTSSYYNESNDPILVTKVEANSEWRSRVRARAQDYTKHCNEEFSAPNWDPEWGSCGEILPSFMKAMEQILYATSEILPKDTYKIGYIVIPHNMTDYEMILDVAMHGAFPFYHEIVEQRDYYILDIIRLHKAAQYGYNLTNPDSLGASWAPNGRVIWETFGENGDIFADDENWILLVNFERDFLELSCVCVQHACDDVPTVRNALLELGEESLWDPDFPDEINTPLEGEGEGESRVQRLSNAISEFINQTSFPNQRSLLRAIVLTGGASQLAMDILRSALSDALPFVEEEWRFKTTVDPAFVPSLGAALRARNEVLAQRKYEHNP